MKAIIVLAITAVVAVSTYGAGTNTPLPAAQTAALVADQDLTDTLPVPVAIKTSFNTKYPNATKVVWYSYVPDPTRPDPAAWNYNMDASDYYVVFNWDDFDYVAWYDNGTWIRSTKHIDNTELPDPVSRVINSQYPGYIITDVDFETDMGQSLYEVKLEKGSSKWNVHVNPQGAILKKKERKMSNATVTTELMTDFESRFPNSSNVVWYAYLPDERVEVMPTDWDYNMDASDYEVRFISDGTEYVAWYDNGRWVRSESYMFDVSKLPSSVNNAIRRDYSGYTIKDVDREDNAQGILYEVEIVKGSDKCKIHYSADGAIVKKKCLTNGVKTKGKS
jgi:uncharacterized membrane protein YkoI